MAYVYSRTVHFADTDAAGVVFFANYLAFCHEAYEEALSAAGIDLKTFFAAHAVIVPISQSEAQYLRPLHAGDKLHITPVSTRLSENTFELRFELLRLGPPAKLAGRVRTEHVCIDAQSRSRRTLPPALAAWLDASSSTLSPGSPAG